MKNIEQISKESFFLNRTFANRTPSYYRSAKTIHSKWTRHQAFQSEIASNKERLEQVQKSGEELLKSKPEMTEIIQPKIDELGDQFEELQQNTVEKGKICYLMFQLHIPDIRPLIDTGLK